MRVAVSGRVGMEECSLDFIFIRESYTVWFSGGGGGAVFSPIDETIFSQTK